MLLFALFGVILWFKPGVGEANHPRIHTRQTRTQAMRRNYF
jgi:uncharacterized iron-regulated membrane protein